MDTQLLAQRVQHILEEAGYPVRRRTDWKVWVLGAILALQTLALLVTLLRPAAH